MIFLNTCLTSTQDNSDYMRSLGDLITNLGANTTNQLAQDEPILDNTDTSSDKEDSYLTTNNFSFLNWINNSLSQIKLKSSPIDPTESNTPTSIMNCKPNSFVSQYSYNTNQLGKPFSCHKCQRTFNSKYTVIRHLKQYHADRRMFKCSVCGRDYKWVDSLHKHMKLHKQTDQEVRSESGVGQCVEINKKFVEETMNALGSSFRDLFGVEEKEEEKVEECLSLDKKY